MGCFEQKPATKVSGMFAGTRDKCFGCKNTVYPTERVRICYDMQLLMYEQILLCVSDFYS